MGRLCLSRCCLGEQPRRRGVVPAGSAACPAAAAVTYDASTPTISMPSSAAVRSPEAPVKASGAAARDWQLLVSGRGRSLSAAPRRQPMARAARDGSSGRRARGEPVATGHRHIALNSARASAWRGRRARCGERARFMGCILECSPTHPQLDGIVAFTRRDATERDAAKRAIDRYRWIHPCAHS